MPTLAQLSVGQSQKETTANQNFAAVSAAAAFAKRVAATTGLTWGYFGGQIIVDGVLTTIADGAIALTASVTNYIEVTRAGVIAAVTGAFTPGRIALYEVVTNASAITSETDCRAFATPFAGRASIAVTTADVTLSAAQARCQQLEFTGTLTGNRSVILPTQAGVFIIANNTVGAFALTVKTAAGTGIVVGQKRRAMLQCDGTNVTRVQTDPDTQDIAYAGTIAPDVAAGERVLVGALTANLIVGAPTNPSKGARLDFAFAQDATGGWTIAWNAVFKKAADAAGAANQKASTAFLFDGTNWIQQGGALTWY